LTVPVPIVNFLVIVLTSFSVLVIGLEVMRRSPRLGAAQLLFLGSLLFQVWSGLEIVVEMHSDDPLARAGVDIAIQPLLTFLACLLLHLTFLFPLPLGLKDWQVPVPYIPFLATTGFRAWVLLAGQLPTAAGTWVGFALDYEPTLVNLIPIGLAMLNLLRAFRKAQGPVVKGRIRAVAVGIAASLVLGTALAVSSLVVIPPEIPTTLAALPVLLALAYSILRYQLFDIQLLKRELAIVTVGALLTAAAATPVVYLAVTVSSPDPVQLAAFLGVFAFALFAAGSRIRVLAGGIVERVLPGLKWKECQLRSLFLVHQSGTLVAEEHSRSPGDADARSFVGEMLVVIQALARESLGMGIGENIRSFNIGSRKLMIEHKGELFLVAEFDGFEHPEIRGEVRKVLERIAERFAAAGHAWDGDITRLGWVESMLRALGSERTQSA
jgi:hypothetical protein